MIISDFNPFWLLDRPLTLFLFGLMASGLVDTTFRFPMALVASGDN